LARSKLPPGSAFQFQTVIATFSCCAEAGSSLLVVHDYQVYVEHMDDTPHHLSIDFSVFVFEGGRIIAGVVLLGHDPRGRDTDRAPGLLHSLGLGVALFGVQLTSVYVFHSLSGYSGLDQRRVSISL
jgi:hypothetical protein